MQVTGGESGNGNGTVTFAVNQNGGATPVSGTLTIAGHTYTVNEAGIGCSYSLSASSASLSAAAGSGSVNVFTSAGCAWTTTSDSTWLTITAGSTGTGNGTVSYAVTTNQGGSPTGNLSTSGFNFPLPQTAPPRSYPINPSRPTLS